MVMFDKGLDCCAGFGSEILFNSLKIIWRMAKWFFLWIFFKLVLQIMAGEAVEMSVKKIEQHHGIFSSWSCNASCNGIFYAEDLTGKDRIAFDKGVERNVFWFVEHLLAE